MFGHRKANYNNNNNKLKLIRSDGRKRKVVLRFASRVILAAWSASDVIRILLMDKLNKKKKMLIYIYRVNNSRKRRLSKVSAKRKHRIGTKLYLPGAHSNKLY